MTHYRSVSQPIGSPPALLPTQPCSVGRQRCSSVDRWSSPLRSHHRHFARPVFTGYVLLSVVLVWRALHGTAPRYLAEELMCYVADMPVGDGERSSPVVDLQSAGCPTVTPFICHSWSWDLERSYWICHVTI